MQAIQCKHPSETEYQTLKLIDPVKVKGKHYAVAVDIYDDRTTDIFMSFLRVLSRNDKVTLITFGHHAEKLSFDMIQCEQSSIVTDFLCRKETGLNTLVGLRYLEQVSADVHIMISAGHHDSAPLNVTSGVNVKLFSPGSEISNYCSAQTFVKDWDVLYFPKNSPHDRLIRGVLDIKHPQYYDINIHGSPLIVCPPLPYGGFRTVRLPYKTSECLEMTCMLFDGTFQVFSCKQEDDESIPYTSKFMKACSMVE